jgi:peptide/nickel transport system substrate-binding protein
MLSVRHASGSLLIGGAIEAETIKNSPLIGMHYMLEQIDFNVLLDHFYDGWQMGPDERIYNAFNLAVTFSMVDDRYMSYHSNQAYTWQNPTTIIDDEIDRLTLAMRELDASQVNEFADYFADLMVRFQEIMPMFPLYSNQTFDIRNAVVIDIPSSPFHSYQHYIARIHKHP